MCLCLCVCHCVIMCECVRMCFYIYRLLTAIKVYNASSQSGSEHTEHTHARTQVYKIYLSGPILGLLFVNINWQKLKDLTPN